MKNIFCSNCGAKLAPGQEFCSECGARVEMSAPAAATKVSAGEVFAKNKKLILGSAIGVGALVLIGIIIFVVLKLVGGSGYKKAITEAEKAINNRVTGEDIRDIGVSYGKVASKYYKALDQIYIIANYDDDEEDYWDDVNERYERVYEEFDRKFGDDWKVTIEIRDAEQFSNSEIKSAQRSYENWVENKIDNVKSLKDNYIYDVDADYFKDLKSSLEKIEDYQVTDGYTLKCKIYIEGEDGDDEEKENFTVIKINGTWVLVDGIF